MLSLGRGDWRWMQCNWTDRASPPSCFIHHEFFCHTDLGLFGLWPTPVLFGRSCFGDILWKEGEETGFLLSDRFLKFRDLLLNSILSLPFSLDWSYPEERERGVWVVHSSVQQTNNKRKQFWEGMISKLLFVGLEERKKEKGQKNGERRKDPIPITRLLDHVIKINMKWMVGGCRWDGIGSQCELGWLSDGEVKYLGPTFSTSDWLPIFHHFHLTINCWLGGTGFLFPNFLHPRIEICFI